ncbi:MAG: Na-translocating system protein MpsC family protein [Cyanobacteria bacterium J06632_19]
MHSQIPNFNDLEKNLAERIQSLFINQLGHKPKDIYCRLLDRKLTIVIENAITKPEKLLISAGYKEIVEKVRNSIEKILQPQFKQIIEEVTTDKISNILFATHLDTNYVSVIALFAEKYALNSTEKGQVSGDSVSN